MNALNDWITVLGVALLLAAPSLVSNRHDRRMGRQLRLAERGGAGEERIPDPPRPHRIVPVALRQNSSSNDTEPSTATWYAEGRRSKKLVSS